MKHDIKHNIFKLCKKIEMHVGEHEKVSRSVNTECMRL